MATAVTSCGFLYEESVEAAAASDSVRVAATAFLGMPGALAAGVSGAGAATYLLDAAFSQGMGKPAAAATVLLDAPNSECMKEFFGVGRHCPGGQWCFVGDAFCSCCGEFD